jgi:hypothetical protein
LFWHGGGGASGDLSHRGKHKLADKVVGVRGVKDREDEIYEVFVGDLEEGAVRRNYSGRF